MRQYYSSGLLMRFTFILFCICSLFCLRKCDCDDADWHAGGKGPDPKVLALNSDMDAYFAAKPDAAAVAAPGATAASE